MKLTLKTIKPLKPRNPFVAAALRRCAGSHRSGMANIAEATDPGVGTRAFGDRFDLSATFDLRRLPNLEGHWKVGLSVILEDVAGVRSYWAVKHPENKLDFHHLDCFALRLPPAG